ncbi:hypothetical protein D3C72_1520800 [compost metagenome]
MQVGGGFLDQFGRRLGESEQRGREGQQQHARNRQCGAQPCGLPDLGADRLDAAGAIELPGDGRQRLQYAHQADIDGDVDRAAQAHGGQVGRRGAPGHHGIDDAKGDNGKLAGQHRAGQAGDTAKVLEQGHSGLGRLGQGWMVSPAAACGRNGSMARQALRWW